MLKMFMLPSDCFLSSIKIMLSLWKISNNYVFNYYQIKLSKYENEELLSIVVKRFIAKVNVESYLLRMSKLFLSIWHWPSFLHQSFLQGLWLSPCNQQLSYRLFLYLSKSRHKRC